MQQRMVIIIPSLGNATHVAVSLPYVEQLLDHRKYLLPENVPPPPSRDFRRMRRTPRAPTVRTMVKLARQCDNAEQLGNELRKRYARKPSERKLAESDARIDRLLAQD